jgi:hypothetical protein
MRKLQVQAQDISQRKNKLQYERWACSGQKYNFFKKNYTFMLIFLTLFNFFIYPFESSPLMFQLCDDEQFSIHGREYEPHTCAYTSLYFYKVYLREAYGLHRTYAGHSLH